MNRRILIIVSCALVLSACASYLVFRAVRTRAPAGAAGAGQIIVAARDLDVGTLIRDADLRTASWIGPLPGGSAANRQAFLDRGVASEIYQGEPVTEKRLALKGSGGGLAAIIPPGMRACAVRVNEVVGVAGFVVPGMRVDVLIIGVPPGGSPADGAKVRTLLQNIQVLSAGTNFQKDAEGKAEPAQVVNLLVTPTQAEILSLAGNETRIQLTLRNPMDKEISKPPSTAVSDLFGGAQAAEPAPTKRSEHVSQAAPLPAPLAPVPVLPVPYVIDVSNGAIHTEAKFSRSPAGKQ